MNVLVHERLFWDTFTMMNLKSRIINRSIAIPGEGASPSIKVYVSLKGCAGSA